MAWQVAQVSSYKRSPLALISVETTASCAIVGIAAKSTGIKRNTGREDIIKSLVALKPLMKTNMLNYLNRKPVYEEGI
jgi:hypothetical protein